MNKYLKPGVAVSLAGMSKQDEHDFIKLCKEAGAGKFYDDDNRGYYNFIGWGKTGSIVLFRELTEELTLITLGQALGRESDVESKNAIVGQSNASNDWFERGEFPPVGAKVQYQAKAPDGHVAIVPYCWYAGTIIAYHDGAVWTSDNGIRQLDNTVFRPLKTEKAKFVERLVLIINDNTTASFTEISGVLYDKGLRFPE